MYKKGSESVFKMCDIYKKNFFWHSLNILQNEKFWKYYN